MDPARQAAYEQAYAAATGRHGSSRIISAATSTASALVKTTSASSSAELRRMEAADNMTITAFLTGFLLFLWHILTSLVCLLWSWIVRPLLLCLLAIALLLLIINTTRLTNWLAEKGEEARDAYDDFALNNTILRTLEQRWASFKLALFNLKLMLRYNWYMDQARLFLQEVRFFYDRVMGNMWKVILLGTITAILANKLIESNKPKVVVGWPGFNNLPPHLAGKEPAWVHKPRKWEGSNSHYQPPIAEKEALPWEDWVNGVGSDESVSSIEPSVQQEVVTVTETEHITQRDSSVGSITHTYTQYTGKQTSKSRPETAEETDYWAPPKGKTVLPNEESVWCRECQQFHCCELPY